MNEDKIRREVLCEALIKIEEEIEKLCKEREYIYRKLNSGRMVDDNVLQDRSTK